MRADGSIKSLTTGVSTVDKTRSPVPFMKVCQNFRNDPIDGLSRRPPAEIIKSGVVTTYTHGTDVFKPFQLDNEHYWLFIEPNTGPFGYATVKVFNDQGVEQTVISNSYEYLNNVSGTEDIEVVSRGNAMYIANKNITVELLDETAPIFEEHSMIVVAHAPRVYTQIRVDWEEPDGVQRYINYEVGEDFPGGIGSIQDPSDVDTGTNTIAENLAAKISAAIVHPKLSVAQKGSTIVFYRDYAQNSGKAGFSRVSVSDGSNNAIYSINGSVDSLEKLPRYSHKGALLEITPDPITSRGRVYMRADSVLEVVPPPVLPSDKFTMTAGKVYQNGGRVLASGYSNGILGGGAFGSLTPSVNLAGWGYPNHDIMIYALQTDWPANNEAASSMTLWVTGSGSVSGNSTSSYIPDEDISFIETWLPTQTVPGYANQTQQQRAHQVFLYAAIKQVVNGVSSAVYKGTIPGPQLFVEGAKYYCYNRDVLVGLDPIPEVRWVEDSAPRENTQINPQTMPHVLVKEKSGEFSFGNFDDFNTEYAGALVRRTSGANETNPFPAFMGKKIDDIATFQGRLAILSDDQVSLSVTNQPNNWFRGTVTQLLSTSPVTVRSTATAANSLKYFVQHNNDLFVMGPTGQFKLDGSVAITPQNAALPQTSAYSMDQSTPPVVMGNEVYFPTSYGWSYGISRYEVNQEIDSQYLAKPMGDHVIGRLIGNCNEISTANNIGLIMSRGAIENWLFTLEFYKYGDQSSLPAWGTWTLDWGARVIGMRARGDFIDVLATGATGSATEQEVSIFRFNLFGNRKFYSSFGDTHLDCRVNFKQVTNTITIPDGYPVHKDLGLDGIVVVASNIYTGGDVIPYTRNGNTITLSRNLGGTEGVTIGYPYKSTLVPPTIDSRDEAGVIQTQASLRITDWHATVTGHFTAQAMTTWGDLGPIFEWEGKQVGDPDFATDQINYSRRTVRIPYKHPNDQSDLVIATESHIGLDIHSLEWRGAYNKNGRRF